MSAHALGVLGVGTEPPPESRLPSLSMVIFDVSASTLARSACVIWPIFSGSVIRESRSSTRRETGSPGHGQRRRHRERGRGRERQPSSSRCHEVLLLLPYVPRMATGRPRPPSL